MDLMLRRRMLMAIAVVRKILHTIASATGLVTFSTQLAEPLESCVCEFVPVQPGSGDPSPDNIRPITGWTGLTIRNAVRASKCFPSDGNTQWAQNGITIAYVGGGRYHVFGQVASASTNNYSASIPFTGFVIPSGTGRLFRMNNTKSGSYTLVLRNGSTQVDTWGLNSVNRESSGYSSMQGKTIDHFAIYINTTAAFDFYIMLEFITSLQQTIPVDWTSDPGTVYGGTLDVATGVLTVDRANFDAYANRTKFAQGNGNVYILGADFNPLGFVYPIKTSLSFSSHFKPLSASSSSTPSFAIGNTGIFAVNGAVGITDTPAHWTAYLEAQIAAGTPVQFVLPLRTPLTYQLTPQQVSTLIGQNTLWHDANGSISVDYYDTQ